LERWLLRTRIFGSNDDVASQLDELVTSIVRGIRRGSVKFFAIAFVATFWSPWAAWLESVSAATRFGIVLLLFDLEIGTAFDVVGFFYDTVYGNVLLVVIEGVEEGVGPLATGELVLVFRPCEEGGNRPVYSLDHYTALVADWERTVECRVCREADDIVFGGILVRSSARSYLVLFCARLFERAVKEFVEGLEPAGGVIGVRDLVVTGIFHPVWWTVKKALVAIWSD